jgi:hypothetical protein
MAKEMTAAVASLWAQGEFGQARLGDNRRTQRLVQMAAQVVQKPAGRLTQVWEEGPERQGAYRLLENEEVEAGDMTSAAVEAAFGRARGPLVVAPTDNSSLNVLAARNKLLSKGFGPVGTDKSKARGLEVVSALLLSDKGVPLGAGGQRYWAREQGHKQPADKRPLEDKETRHTLEVFEQVLEARQAAGYKGRVWFQHDRAGDTRDVLHWAVMADAWVTVRAAQDRRVQWPQEGRLWEVMGAQQPLGTYSLKVPEGPERSARKALLEVRAQSVVLPLAHHWTKKQEPVEVFAVQAVEISAVPQGEERIEWMLLTTCPVRGFAGARRVLKAYALRWRLEEVHKCWKSNCQVEKSNLHEAGHFIKWASLLFSVAVRIERLKRLAREAPELPADVELSRWEIRGLQLRYDAQGLRSDDMPSIEQAVLWIARLGGYSKSSGGPPGSITIGRGLKTLAIIADDLQRLQELGLKM